MKKIERYTHHTVPVAVYSELKGKHRDHCLCYDCAFFAPESREKNCQIANALFEFDKLAEVTTPVWECAKFVEK